MQLPLEAAPIATPPRWRRSDDNNWVIEFAHRHANGSAVWLQSSSVSAGLRRLVCLFERLLVAMESKRMLLIDEFDSTLHPLVARYMIEFANSTQTSDKGAQLLLTSHNISLMDMGALRRDEMWLMELDEHQASRLLRLWGMPKPPRKGERIGKQYLFGRYGAVPEVNSPDATRRDGKSSSKRKARKHSSLA
jgi:AAA15 family ATPase/GTPase